MSSKRQKNPGDEFSWDNIRYFIAAAERGSIKAAASFLNTSPATVRKALDEFERSQQRTLTIRNGQGITLTEAGEDAYKIASQMRSVSNSLRTMNHPTDDQPVGVVKIAALQTVSCDLIAHNLGDFTKLYPDIQIYLDVDTYVEDPVVSDADLTLSYEPSKHPDAISSQIGFMHIVFFASIEYIERSGLPKDLIEGLSHNTLMLTTYQKVLEDIHPYLADITKVAKYAITTNNSQALTHAIVSGAGIGAIPSWMIHKFDNIYPIISLPSTLTPLIITYDKRAKHRKAVMIVRDWLESLIDRQSIHHSDAFQPSMLLELEDLSPQVVALRDMLSRA